MLVYVGDDRRIGYLDGNALFAQCYLFTVRGVVRRSPFGKSAGDVRCFPVLVPQYKNPLGKACGPVETRLSSCPK